LIGINVYGRRWALLASKAARIVEAARGRPVIDFGSRRAQGVDAAVNGARAFYVAGLSATSAHPLCSPSRRGGHPANVEDRRCRKQVFREFDRGHDVIATADEALPLLQPVMARGRRVNPPPTLDTVRAHARREITRLPPHLRSLGQAEPYPVAISGKLARAERATRSRIAEADIQDA
jgi:nicotinic acid phosphoribosyltransferase